MKIFVCIKQVPDTTVATAVKEDGTLDRAAMPAVVNPDDLNAVEAALRLKAQGGAEVIAISMGPDAAFNALQEVLAMGVDRAILVSAREFGGSDTYATSQILAAAITHAGFGPEDIILCGHQAIDGDTAQVGPQIAEKLGLNQVTYAAQIEKTGGRFSVKRLLEDGYMTLDIAAPCLITCVKELNRPRYMSVGGIEWCCEQEIPVFDYNELKDEPLIEPDTIGLKGSPTNVFISFTEPQKKTCTMYPGTVEAAAQALVAGLREKHTV